MSLALAPASSSQHIEVLARLEDLGATLARPDLELDEVLGTRDKAEVLRAYARSAKLGLDVANRATELRLRAERRAGAMLRELLAEGPPIKRRDGRIRDRRALPNGTLERAGITSQQSSHWIAIAQLPEAEFDTRVEAIRAAGRQLTVATFVRAARQFLRQPGKGGNGSSSPTLNALRKVLALMREIKTLQTPAEVAAARAVLAIGESWNVELERPAQAGPSRPDVTARELSCLLCGRPQPSSCPPRCQVCGGAWLTV